MWAFPAMGTEIRVTAPGLDEPAEERLAELVCRRFRDAEARFSRFRPDSELAALNRAEGPMTVSREMFEALAAARGRFDATEGLFDPAIGGALAALGYDRSFAPGALDRVAPRRAPRAAPRGTFADVVLEEETRTVFRPRPMQIDLGGLVKGRTADAAARLLPARAAVDAGGDAVLRGDDGDGGGWPVEVEDPSEPARTLLVLCVRDRAVATSAPNRRAWRVGDARAHHLIDPRTSRSGASDLAQVTVVAPDAETAEVLAKVAYLRGRDGARRWLTGLHDVGAVLVSRSGTVELAGEIEVLQ